jgi:hypothetical protein
MKAGEHQIKQGSVAASEAHVTSTFRLPPRRLTLGSNAYEAIAATWRDRLAALEAQRDLANSTDADDIRVRGRV